MRYCANCKKFIGEPGASWYRVEIESPSCDPPPQTYFLCSTLCLEAWAKRGADSRRELTAMGIGT